MIHAFKFGCAFALGHALAPLIVIGTVVMLVFVIAAVLSVCSWIARAFSRKGKRR